MMTYTTLAKIREHRPCTNDWKKLLQYLGKTEADDEPLSLSTILDSNGFADALWCLRAVDGIEQEARLYAVWCVRQVQHLMSDPRSVTALDVAEQYANGVETRKELDVARDAAKATAWAAAAVCAAAVAAADSAVAAARAVFWAAAAAVAAAEAVVWAASEAEVDAVRIAQIVEFRRRFCQQESES